MVNNMSTYFDEFKLHVDWKPIAYHGHTVRKNLSGSLWTKIRLKVLEEQKNTCCICGYSPDHSDGQLREMHAHEVEKYSTDELLCTLVGINLLCKDCHDLNHFGRVQLNEKNERIEKLIEHFMNVNNCFYEDWEDYRFDVIQVKSINKQKEFSKLAKSKNNVCLFRIEGDIPYKEEVIIQLTNKGLYKL